MAAAFPPASEPTKRASSGRGPSPVHSAHVGQFVEVHYRWHALFGRQFRVERVDRRKFGQFVPGIFMVVAAWMLDPATCTGMDLGTPRVSLAALSDLDDLLRRADFGEALPVMPSPERNRPMQDLPTGPSSRKRCAEPTFLLSPQAAMRPRVEICMGGFIGRPWGAQHGGSWVRGAFGDSGSQAALVG